ncbi:hypothetical protein [Desulfovibrio sp. DV]|uniref:hypothetical protein n=1 Tax=Desulfovibrio sp. DV TaxID=1844708 RepID=UPI000AA2BF9C|nr:hypothetical protein [Desulfovibrio sp. DV]
MDFFFERIAINDIEIQCCELSQNRIFYYEPAEATRVLFVTFSHLGFGKFSPAWGWDYCKDRKFSILGVVHKDENWFRSPDLMDFFNSSAYKKINRWL